MDDGTRRCVRCGTIKPLSSFERKTKRVNGFKEYVYCGACKACSGNYYRTPTRVRAPTRRFKLDIPRKYLNGTANVKEIGNLVEAFSVALRTYCGLDPFVARFQSPEKLVQHLKVLEKFPAEEVEATINRNLIT